MEKQFNTDLTQVSKKTVERNKRLEEQTNEYLENYYGKLRSEELAKEKALQEEVLNNARFTQGSIYSRSKNRVRAMQEAIQYTDKATKAVLTDVIVGIVNESLLLDTEEYAKLNPSYQDEIRQTVASFVEKADLNEKFTDKRVLDLMEHITRTIPAVETGVYMEAEEIASTVRKLTPEEMEEKYKEFSGEVKDRVASIVSKEQDEVNKIQDEVDEILGIVEAKRAERDGQALVEEEEGEEEVELSDEEMAMAEEDVEEELPEEEMVEEPVDEEEDEYLAYQQDDSQYKPKETKIKISPEGSVEVSIKEKFYREVPRTGILEGFAVNEALDMVKAGKEYNGDLALANALTYITVIEAFNVLELMDVKEQDYKKMLNPFVK
jgi:hypothetical protein